MNVIIDRRALEDFIKSMVNEERSFHTANISEIPAKDDEDEPIVPREQMAVQLSVDEPPVEDPEFIPASSVELGNSASVIAREVPSHQIEYYYRQLHKLLDRALDREEARLRGDLDGSSGVRLIDYSPDLEKFEKKSAEDQIRESIRRLLAEQDDAPSVEDAIQGVLDHLRSINFGYTTVGKVLGGTGQRPQSPDMMQIQLRQKIGPADVDPAVSQIFSRYNLTPDQIDMVRHGVTQAVMKSVTPVQSEPPPTDWSQEQLDANKAVDQIALRMLKGEKDSQTGEWMAPPATQEDVAAELVRRSESETDQNMINAYQEMAQMILSKSGAAEELRARRESEREIQALRAQDAAEEEEVVAAPKDLSDLWTQIAKEEGFASAAGARQFAFKPMIKYYLESMAIPPDVMETIKGRALQTFKRGMRSFSLGVDRNQVNQIVRSSRIAPEMSGDHFRTYFKLIFFQPFVNDFLKAWKVQAGVILSEMGIQDPKQVFAKMLIGETSPNSKSAKAKIAAGMTPIQFSQALERARAWSADPANSTALAQQYAQRIEEPAKVKNSIQKALSNPEV